MSDPAAWVLFLRSTEAAVAASRHYRPANPAMAGTIEEPRDSARWQEHSSSVLQLNFRTAHSLPECTLIRLSNAVVRSRSLLSPVQAWRRTHHLQASHLRTNRQSTKAHKNRSRTLVEHRTSADRRDSVPTSLAGSSLIHSHMIRTCIHWRADRTSALTMHDEMPSLIAASVVDGCVFGNCPGSFDHLDKGELSMYNPRPRCKARCNLRSRRVGNSLCLHDRSGCSQRDIPAEQNSGQ